MLLLVKHTTITNKQAPNDNLTIDVVEIRVEVVFLELKPASVSGAANQLPTHTLLHHRAPQINQSMAKGNFRNQSCIYIIYSLLI